MLDTVILLQELVTIMGISWSTSTSPPLKLTDPPPLTESLVWGAEARASGKAPQFYLQQKLHTEQVAKPGLEPTHSVSRVCAFKHSCLPFQTENRSIIIL